MLVLKAVVIWVPRNALWTTPTQVKDGIRLRGARVHRINYSKSIIIGQLRVRFHGRTTGTNLHRFISDLHFRLYSDRVTRDGGLHPHPAQPIIQADATLALI